MPPRLSGALGRHGGLQPRQKGHRGALPVPLRTARDGAADDLWRDRTFSHERVDRR